jgi:crotonobetainyl-CoA:carnitine CoA-transferase CaiB-like acyl-CoA transferase
MEPIDGTFLAGVRVLELADELGEYCGRRLAALGADVVKIEPPGGEVDTPLRPVRRRRRADVEQEPLLLALQPRQAQRRLDLDTAEGQESPARGSRPPPTS